MSEIDTKFSYQASLNEDFVEAMVRLNRDTDPNYIEDRYDDYLEGLVNGDISVVYTYGDPEEAERTKRAELTRQKNKEDQKLRNRFNREKRAAERQAADRKLTAFIDRLEDSPNLENKNVRWVEKEVDGFLLETFKASQWSKLLIALVKKQAAASTVKKVFECNFRYGPNSEGQHRALNKQLHIAVLREAAKNDDDVLINVLKEDAGLNILQWRFIESMRGNDYLALSLPEMRRVADQTTDSQQTVLIRDSMVAATMQKDVASFRKAMGEIEDMCALLRGVEGKPQVKIEIGWAIRRGYRGGGQHPVNIAAQHDDYDTAKEMIRILKDEYGLQIPFEAQRDMTLKAENFAL
ncbi:MAG: hypothetical protein H6867_06315 [Rhodospirillales bacterium]|nr:hypothetical protein [Rhodospirillales bacterium]MCB9995145.1 hypothetical protein [Rhodospirillales bacterium]